MQLALLTYSFAPEIGGVQTYLREIIQRLATLTGVTVITPIPPGPSSASGPFRQLTIANGRASAFWQALRQSKPDRVLLGHAHPQLLLAALLYRRQFAAIAHGNDYLAAQQRWHRPLFNWMLACARPLITQTEANKQRLQSLGLPTAIVIHPGADPHHFMPQPAMRAVVPRLLTVGRLVSRKGFDLVLQAMPLIRQHVPHLQLEIVGDGPDRTHLQQLANDLGLHPVVTFSGHMNDAELLAAYQRAHLFVMPAREETDVASVEGFGIVYLEASACGLPVVAARSGGVAEAVQDGRTGLLIPPNDPTTLARAITTLLQNPSQMHQLGAHGRQWVLATMNWDVAARKLAEALQVCI